MALIKKFDVVRDIQMMVRKGAFQFEEKDRPVVYLNDMASESPMAVRLGGVEFDDERQALMFTAYDMDGRFIPRGEGEARELSVLSGRSLLAVKETVGRYFECSLNRARNIEMISSEVLNGKDGNLNLVFPADRPVVSFEDVAGNAHRVAVDELFYPELAHSDTHEGRRSVSGDAQLHFSGTDQGGRRVNGRLFELNDICVQNIVNVLSTRLGKTLETRRDEKREHGINAGRSTGRTF